MAILVSSKNIRKGASRRKYVKPLKIHNLADVSDMQSPFGGWLEACVLCDLLKNHDRSCNRSSARARRSSSARGATKTYFRRSVTFCL
jgi:hypothetical protein